MSAPVPGKADRPLPPSQHDVLEKLVLTLGYFHVAKDCIARATELLPVRMGEPMNLPYLIEHAGAAHVAVDQAYCHLTDIARMQEAMLQAIEENATAPTVKIDDVPGVNGHAKGGDA